MLVGEADSYGLPTITHIYPKGVGKEHQYDEEYVTYAASAAELNVDIVKTFIQGILNLIKKWSELVHHGW